MLWVSSSFKYKSNDWLLLLHAVVVMICKTKSNSIDNNRHIMGTTSWQKENSDMCTKVEICVAFLHINFTSIKVCTGLGKNSELCLNFTELCLDFIKLPSNNDKRYMFS